MNEITHSQNVIPKQVALQLCAEIRQDYSGRWYTFAGLQCWGCTTVSKGDPTRMCFSSQPDYRGCNLVNARFDRIETSKPAQLLSDDPINDF
jgi:hypothetical protein